MSRFLACRFLACFLLTTLPAAALVPDPACYVDDAGRIWAPEDGQGDLAVWPWRSPGGVSTWSWVDDRGAVQGVVEICATGETLRYALPADDPQHVTSRIGEMVDSERSYTMGALRRVIRRGGGEAWMTTSTGRCGCQAAGY